MLPDWEKHPCKTGMYFLLESARLENSRQSFAHILNFKHNNNLRHPFPILFTALIRPLIGKIIAVSQCSLAHNRMLSAY
jgi:hypothetical protein